MAKIYINKLCSIAEENNHSFLSALDRHLSFYIAGAEYSSYYKSGFWNGQKHLMTSDLTFPYGLLPRVQQFYNDNNISLEIIDKREPKSKGLEIDVVSKLKKLGKEPFYYQIDALNACLNKDQGIVKISTGGGKSIISSLIVSSLGKKTIVYVIGKSLLYQLYNLYKSLFDQEIGIIGDGICNIKDINIATFQSIGRALDVKIKKEDEEEGEKDILPSKYKIVRQLLVDAKVHIFDECHYCSAPTFIAISNYINPEHIYGMSATPHHDNPENDLLIESILGNKIIDISATKLINEGYLVEPLIKFIKSPQLLNCGSHYKTIYQNYIVNHDIRNNLIVNAAQKLVEKNYQTLVSFNSIEHGNILFNLISKKIPSAILLSGKDNNKVREEAFQKIENGEIRCLIASKICDIGIDLPSLSGLVIASGGSSSVRALQRIGRVIRKFPNKDRAAIVDFVDQVKYLSDHSNVRKKVYEKEEFKVIWNK